MLRNRNFFLKKQKIPQAEIVRSWGKLHISKKQNAMEQKIFNEYAAFERLMDEKEIWRDPSIDFARACSLAGAVPLELEIVLAKELGYLGEELIEAYRALI